MNRTQKHRLRPDFDSLDHRCLMAAGVTAKLARGILTVTGTDAADVINVAIQGNTARGKRTVPGAVVVTGARRAFRLNQVRSIVVVGNAGNDAIAVTTRGNVTVPVSVAGGAGDDVLSGYGNLDGGPGQDTINGVPDSPIAPTSVPPAPAPPADGPSVVPIAPAPTTPPVTAPISALGQLIVDLTNQQRQAAGLVPLKVNAQLTAAAHIQATNTAVFNTLAHTLPGAAQPGLVDRARYVGYGYSTLGENLAFNYADGDALLVGWMGSPDHRANILNGSYTEIGVAVAYDSQGQPYYCQVFGKPL
jgi:uncharacterized protein YkwD